MQDTDRKRSEGGTKPSERDSALEKKERFEPHHADDKSEDQGAREKIKHMGDKPSGGKKA
jgi:hypothetical protein